MKASLNWLSDYVDIPVSAEQLAQALIRVGLEVESEFIETDSDLVLDIEVTSNRPDCLGHLGLAREIAAALGQTLRLPDPQPAAAGEPVDATVAIEVADAVLCPRYTARLIRGVKIGPSPAWLVERLEAVGMRSVNNVVDVTNYVLMEYSQPLHAFDYDKLAGGRIVVRRARPGETITAIDGSRCELADWMGVIADAEKPVAIAGVMGGLDSEVGDDTVNILLESAAFDPLTIRKGSRTLGLMSESSYRFERGVDLVALEAASRRACELILQVASGELAPGVVDVREPAAEAPTVAMRSARCNALLGIEVPVERQVEILATLGLAPRVEGEAIVCTVPSHRGDLTREVDLIEEVGRIYGLDKLPIGHSVTHRIAQHAPVEAARKAIGDVLTAAGYYEAITTSFIDDEEARLLGQENSLSVDRRLRRTNGVLRQDILPSLLRCRKLNQDAGVDEVRFFEIAAVFPPDASATGEALPLEYTQVALLSDGSLRELRGALEAVLRRFNPQATLEVEPADAGCFAAGQGARLSVRGGENAADLHEFGCMGAVDARLRDFYGLAGETVAAMVRFDVLAALGGSQRRYRPAPRFPSIRRDLSLVVAEDLSWSALTGAIAADDAALLRGVEFVGEYRGKQVGAGRKSVTLRLEYRHDERTLTHEEVDQHVAAVVKTLTEVHKAELRG